MAKEIMIYIKGENPVNVKRLIMALLDLGYSVWKYDNHICFQLGGDDQVIPPDKDKMFEDVKNENL